MKAATVKATVRGLAPSLLVALVGAALLRITVGSDVFLQYVKEGLRIPLIASGIVLLGLGIAGVVRRVTANRQEPVMRFGRDAEGNAVWLRPVTDDGHGHGKGHDHDHGPRVAWLLAVPAVLLLCFTPPPLGSFTASRDGTDAVVEPARYTDLSEQPAAPGSAAGASGASVTLPTPMSLTEFIGRSRDPQKSLAGRKVRLTGFVSPGAQPGEWYLNRLVVSCCAADARRLRVLVHASGPAPAADSWVDLTGTWKPTPDAPATAAPRIDVTEQHAVPQPRAPYRDIPPADQ
ncbi:putative repeat protein (TIGR03943 family) [Streptomyces sp. 1114.5]|uniref:TIGR03943 family putative permease subunit n=1 Tax=Streptomyces sp. 1114.5 TaxID=1938830 RepID=UPI000EAE99F8|nr:TIGR03943 family protein [Streptomyces sp. 1114.5]RKT19461.1 putative repeat protein (TIGR03943 family) [Streptomyces sp. 1114.5]